MIRHAETGWLVTSRDHDDLVCGMLTLLRDGALRRELGSKGRRDAVERFSVERFMSEVLALYRDVLEGDKTQEQRSNRAIEVRGVVRASRP